MTEAYIREHPDRFLATAEGVAAVQPVRGATKRKKADHRSPEVARENMAAMRLLAGGSG